MIATFFVLVGHPAFGQTGCFHTALNLVLERYGHGQTNLAVMKTVWKTLAAACTHGITILEMPYLALLRTR